LIKLETACMWWSIIGGRKFDQRTYICGKGREECF